MAMGLFAAPAAFAAELKVINIGQTSDVLSFDPHDQNDMGSATALRHIYSRLVKVTKAGEVAGDLAADWKISDDNYTVTFNLRKGVKYHDGVEFTADDVKFSFEKQKTFPKEAHNIAMVDTVTVVDPYTVAVKLTNPAPAVFLMTITHVGCSIVPKIYTEKMVADGKSINEFPIGTGPYKFVSHRGYDRAILVPFEGYFGTKPANAGLTIKIIPDDSARTIALETGDIDFLVNVPPVDVRRIQDNKNLALDAYPSTWMEFLVLNQMKTPFDNKLVRQAISHLMDREAIIAVAENGQAVPLYSPIAHGQVSYSEMFNKYPYDIDKAKALLAEAGYPNGFKTEVMLFATNRENTAVIMQQSFEKVGIIMSIQNMERGAFYDATGAGQHDMDLGGWIAGDEPDSALGPLYRSTSAGDAGNRWFLRDPKIDQYMDEAKLPADMSERRAIYAKLFEYMIEEAHTIPLYTKNESVARKANLVGAQLFNTGQHFYDQLHFE